MAAITFSTSSSYDYDQLEQKYKGFAAPSFEILVGGVKLAAHKAHDPGPVGFLDLGIFCKQLTAHPVKLVRVLDICDLCQRHPGDG